MPRAVCCFFAALVLGAVGTAGAEPVVYWGDFAESKIQRAEAGEPGIEDLVLGYSGAAGVAVDASDGRVYWVDRAIGSIQRSRIDGSDVEELVTGLEFLVSVQGMQVSGGWEIALDVAGGKMYWSSLVADGSQAVSAIQRANLDGSNVEELVRAPLGVFGIALDVAGGKLYWTVEDRIQRANLDGSSPEDVLTGISRPQAIDLDVADGRMYWTDAGGIRRANLDGTSIENLVSFAGTVLALGVALDPGGGKMYWTQLELGGDETIQRANLDGSGVEELVSEFVDSPFTQFGPTVGGVAVDSASGRMYWTEAFWIRSADLDGSAIANVATGTSRPGGIALDPAGGKMYWSQDQWIRRSDLDGGNIEDLVAGDWGFNNPAIALDLAAGKLYWTDPGFDARIRRANLDGSNPQDVITGIPSPILPALALNLARGRLYWADRNGIHRAVLDGSGVENLLPDRGAIALALDPGGGKLYWVSRTSIRRADLNGTNAETLVSESPLIPQRGLALDLAAGKMYWSSRVARSIPVEGSIRRANLDGSSAEDVVTGLAAPGAIALDIRVRVLLDVKPGNDQNPINPLSRGVIPVAILGSDTFDVADVDPTTLAFGPAGALLAHRNGPHVKDANQDGVDDLLGHFRTEDAGIAVGDDEACVTGERLDGTPFEGCDSIRTVPACGLGSELLLLLPPLMWLRARRRAGTTPAPRPRLRPPHGVAGEVLIRGS